ncbi:MULTISPECIES: SDR family oxidoreductase [unclassified Arthrobacter]|uniref:SDR family NAD(P)-dependent oxidoreductase n=1 Tax=unclassified Arthrobacter TaxID=235627 RepID=UPI001E5889A8|nr:MULTISPECIES: SDR family oxidoreductase [unclassified Arthrobacter]MCC9145810.1 SDR family oxidoreductase [Arthrobacter sp. zg-Y919]MDK1277039.1 SDR family oxidoreductase [Arthrobacter sp. zg.Y919]WIB03568.1 SDR family oxidoreductase [Arthrobacter sp. zg-Y919]
MGTNILVTGAGRGIGSAIAAALAEAGCTVAVHAGHDAGAAQAVADALPGTGHVVVGDLASPAECERVFADAVDQLGGLDVLVNNAGIFRAQPVTSGSFEDWQATWRQTIDVNLMAPANLCRLMAEHLLQRPEGPAGGRLVNVGSRGAYRGEPENPAYGASKAGLHSLTQSLAVALAPHGIFSAAVAPGFVDTRMGRPDLEGARGAAIRAQSPFNRVAEPEEVAATAAWLATDAPLWVSGTVIDVNGASYLR